MTMSYIYIIIFCGKRKKEAHPNPIRNALHKTTTREAEDEEGKKEIRESGTKPLL